MGAKTIDIVIVNWNAGDQLRTCVYSIIQHGAGLVNQALVIDNGSVDGSDDSVEGLPIVMLIRTGANQGFGKACNLGALRAESDFVLFLNPDATLYADTLPKALAYIQNPENTRVGICGVQLLDEYGHISRSCTRSPTVGGFERDLGRLRYAVALVATVDFSGSYSVRFVYFLPINASVE